MWMRGGTSKGGYFLANDLPERRDEFLLRMMGSPDVRQIDGMGGADPLASKVAIVKKSDRPGVDVDYLFLQVAVDQPVVSDAQNCGNLLAGVGPFAIERDLIEVSGDIASVTIFMENTGQTAIAKVPIDNGRPVYTGSTSIDGVPGSAAAIPLEFKDTAGSSCGALLPTGNEIDTINGTGVTMIDNGMPVVVLRASDMNIRGDESRDELEADAALKSRLEAIRLACGLLMNLGDVEDKTVPKMTMVSTPGPDGTISTRTFIPHRCHSSIGVLGLNKGGVENYQLTLGGRHDENASIGERLGPGVAGDEVPLTIERIVNFYTDVRNTGESLSDTYDRVGKEAFKEAAYV